MNAKLKSSMVTLSVRIPAELRAKLKRGAGLKGRSAAKEVAWLIDEQLSADAGMHTQLTLAQAKAAACEAYLNSIMQLVLHATAPGTALDPVEQLAKLHTRFQALHARKVQDQQALESQLRERANRPLTATQVLNNPFRQLDSTVDNEATRTQLDIPERRWVNLRSIIHSSPKGTKTLLANALGWDRSQISQLISAPSARGHRKISDLAARKLEQALGLDKGKLDEIETSLSIVKIQQASIDLGAMIRPKLAAPVRRVKPVKD